MNKDLYSLEHEPAIRLVRPLLPKMIVISLLLHGICTIILLGGRAGRPGMPSINFIDLTMSELQSSHERQADHSPPPIAAPTESALPSQEEAAPLTDAEKMQQDLQNAISASAEQPDAMEKVSFGLGMLNGHFGTIADGRTLRDDMREYYLSLLRTINEKWWLNQQKFEGSGAILNVFVNRNGEIFDAKILQSSGNQSQDRTILKSLVEAGPVPPLPTHYPSPVFVAPVRFNAPLTFFGSKSG
jgi:TonB family protein